VYKFTGQEEKLPWLEKVAHLRSPLVPPVAPTIAPDPVPTSFRSLKDA
ncbi:hypothetical protein A2U01_0090395, partial [Trifolium medium]|nr:hypothetical protein [Trifolium medium]